MIFFCSFEYNPIYVNSVYIGIIENSKNFVLFSHNNHDKPKKKKKTIDFKWKIIK